MNRERGLIPWVMLAAGAVGLLAVGSLVAYIKGAENAKNNLEVALEEISRITLERDEAVFTAKVNQASFEMCEEVNLANAEKAAEAEKAVREAREELEHMESLAALDKETIEREADRLRNRQLTCPALDDEFRGWVLDGS